MVKENEIAYIVGAMKDGSYIQNKKHHIYRITLYQKNKKWLEYVSNMFEHIFSKKPRIEIDKRDNVWRLIMDSKRIFMEMKNLNEFSINKTSITKKMYIRGFFDSEGGVPHVEKRKILPKNMRAHFTQSDRLCLLQLKEMISSFGIKTGKVCGPYLKKGFSNPIYRLKIHGIREISKFADIIGSDHPEKQHRLSIISRLDTNKA